MNVTYNQNYMYPAFYTGPGYVGIQYPCNVYSMDGIYATTYPETPTSGFCEPVMPTSQLCTPFISADNCEVYENTSAVHQISPTRIDVKPFAVPDTTARASCAFEDVSNQSVTQVCSSIKGSENAQTDNQRQCLNSPSSPRHQLRLPTITVTPNMAANVMSEECDLGYCSFTDLSPLPEVTEGTDAALLNEMLDAQSTFSDIIDDVLDSMDNSAFGDDHMTSPDLPDFKWKSPVADYSGDEYTRYDCQKQNSQDQSNDLCDKTQVRLTEGRESTTCGICNKTFEAKACLKAHMRLHKRERPHRCQYCDKSFTQKSTLRTHVRTHTGEKPYVCQYCSRAFSDYSTFRKHVRIHTGEKPYTCEICQRSFTQSGNMLRHKEMHYKAGK